MLLNKQKHIFYLFSFMNMIVAMGSGRFLFSLMPTYLHQEYLFSYYAIGILGSTIVLGYMLFSLLGGEVLYRLGERLGMILSLLLISLSFMVFAFVNNFFVLCIAGFLMGAMANSIFVLVFPLVFRFINKKQYGTGIGIINSGSGAGVAMVSIIYIGLLQFDEVKITSIWIISALLAFLLLCGSFYFFKNKNIAPLLKPNNNYNGKEIWQDILYKKKHLVNLNRAYFLFGYAYASYSSYIVAHAIIGRSEQFGTLIWIIFGTTTMLGSYIWGALFDKSQNAKILCLNYIIISTSMMLPGIRSSIFTLLVSIIGFGICFEGFISIIGTIMTHVGRGNSGLYMAKLTFMHALGQVLGTFVGGIIREQTGAFQDIFLLSFFMALLSFIFFLNFLKHSRKLETLR